MLCLRSVLELFIVFNFEDVGVEAGDPVLSVCLLYTTDAADE